MASSRLARFVVPAATALVAATVAMALAGRPNAHAQLPNAPEPPRGLTSKRITPQEAAPQLANAGPPPGFLRKAGFSLMTATVAGRQVVVKGAANVSESVAGNAYVWLLRVYSSRGKKALLDEQHYPDGAVVVEQPGDIRPAFADAIELPPGKYKIELTLYAVPRGFAVDKLPFGADMKKAALIKVSRFEKVEIVD